MLTSSGGFNVGDYVVVINDPNYLSDLQKGDAGHIRSFYGALGGLAAYIVLDDNSEHRILLKDVALFEETTKDIIESDVSLEDLFGGVAV